jgi:hypothetical protein
VRLLADAQVDALRITVGIYPIAKDQPSRSVLQRDGKDTAIKNENKLYCDDDSHLESVNQRQIKTT